jgi:hypothetical protein
MAHARSLAWPPLIAVLQVHAGQNYIVGVWDTAGAERFEAMTRIYFKVPPPQPVNVLQRLMCCVRALPLRLSASISQISTLWKNARQFSRAFFIRFSRLIVAQFWVSELQKYEPKCRIALVGCKSDLSTKASSTKLNGGGEDSASAPVSPITMR